MTTYVPKALGLNTPFPGKIYNNNNKNNKSLRSRSFSALPYHLNTFRLRLQTKHRYRAFLSFFFLLYSAYQDRLNPLYISHSRCDQRTKG